MNINHEQKNHEQTNKKMNHQSFIHKYKPTKLTDFDLKADTFSLLTNLVACNNLNVLLIGDTGCGKTSLLNCLIQTYYGKTAYSPENVLFISSLKEQGIVYYRTEVKTFCQTSSSVYGKQKIVVLDDLDVINEQGQQVFRNCIDKYSYNVHFIASCSNIQKIIDSIQSRLVIIQLNVLSIPKLNGVMQQIVLAENLNITPEAQQFILSISNHSLSTVINYLEKFKLINLATITLDVATTVCTNISFQDFTTFTLHVKGGKTKDAIAVIYNLFDRGYSVMDILDTYFLFVKSTNMLSEEQRYKAVELLCRYITIFHNVHEESIELAFFTNQMVKTLSVKN